MKRPEKYYQGDPWTIAEEGFCPDKQRLSESIFSVSNEHMGVRGYFEEGYSGDHLLGSYFNHLYDYLEIGHDQFFKGMIDKSGAMINAVDWLYTRIAIDGEQLDLASVKFSSFRRTLDMKKLLYTRAFVWRLQSGREIKITFMRFLNMHTTKMGCQRILLEPLNFSGHADIVLGLDFNTRYEIASGWTQTQTTGSASSDKGKNFWKEVQQASGKTSCQIMSQTKGTGFQLFSGFHMFTTQSVSPQVLSRDKFIGLQFSLSLEKNKTACIDKIVINHWKRTTMLMKTGKTESHSPSSTRMLRLTRPTSSIPNLWKTSGIASPSILTATTTRCRGCVFPSCHAIKPIMEENPCLNPLCKGLTGEVYFGWAFWDTEIYCHRFHLFANPQAAKNLLMYRYHTLGQALQRARDLDCRGARYPFATISGYEDSGTWQHVDLEHHISGAIGYAIWQYDTITKDKDFLYQQGIEMLLEISRFYASAGDYSPLNGDFGLYGVMGPDEFHMMVNHNFYTNYLAKKVFLFTLDVLEEIKSKCSPALRIGSSSGYLWIRQSRPNGKTWPRKCASSRILIRKYLNSTRGTLICRMWRSPMFQSTKSPFIRTGRTSGSFEKT